MLKMMYFAHEEVLLLKFGGNNSDQVITPEVILNISMVQDFGESLFWIMGLQLKNVIKMSDLVIHFQ